jgi:TolA-binding protein
MIVTRQRVKKKSSLPILLPIAAIVMLAVALTWPPSRNFIVNGPLKPVANVAIGAWSVVARPLTFAYQQQQITDRNVEIKQLNDKLESERKDTSSKDAQVAQLQKQLTDLQNQPAEAATAAPVKPLANASGAPGAIPGAAAAAPDTTTEAIKRTAAQWAAMDPEKAAAVIAKLPETYDAQVLAQMPADSVGPIMDALPAGLAARIIQAGGPSPQISVRSSR